MKKIEHVYLGKVMKKLLLLFLIPTFVLQADEGDVSMNRTPPKKPQWRDDPHPPPPTRPRPITPSARGCPGNNGFLFFADFLWWTANEEDNLGFSFRNTNPVTFEVGDVIRMDNSWDPGVRIGIGWNTPNDGWDVQAYWTYFHNHTNTNVTSPTNDQQLGLVSNWLNDIQDQIGSARATWIMNYNSIILELGRDFFVSRLALRPYVSGENIWIYKTFRANYGDPDPSLANPSVPGNYRGKSDYWGLVQEEVS